MLESIGQLQTLEELQIWCSTISVPVLASMLSQASLLQKVYFFRVGLAVTSPQDFDQLGRAVENHPSLTDIRIGGFHIAGVSHQNTATSQYSSIMDPFLIGLSKAPCLEVLNLQLSSPNHALQGAPFSPMALGELLQSRTVTDLYLSRLGLGPGHIEQIYERLPDNIHLSTLDLFGNNLRDIDIINIVGALRVNQALETLVLPCSTQELSIEACAALSSALRENSTLRTLNLPRSNLNDDGLWHLAEGLTVNTTLKKIEVGVGKDLSAKGKDALTSLLEQNYQLERLVLSSSEKAISDKVEYYMRLNEVGRGSLLRDGNASREQWVEMLITCRDDLDCLFYFVSMNPSLCQFANTSHAEVIITEEFKPMRRHSFDYFRVAWPSSRRITESSRRASVF